MANIILFVRPTKKSTFTKVGFRLVDGRSANVFFTSDIVVDSRLWDQKRQMFKSNLKLLAEDVRINTINEINRIKELILYAYNNRKKDIKVDSAWLKSEIQNLMKEPETIISEPEKSFFELFDFYITNHRITEHRKDNYRVVLRSIQRFEKYKQMKTPSYQISFKNMNSDTLREIENYIRHEHEYYTMYPELFKDFPAKKKPSKRGDNTISTFFSKFRAFTIWSIKRDKTIDDPFNDYEVVKEVYSSPIFLTQAERNKLYLHDFSNKPHLEVQRDIFIFQCFIGCRVGDLYKLTKKSVDLVTYEENGEIHQFWELGYIAGKTKDGDPKVITVPLTKIAESIYLKYKNTDTEKIFPFISVQKYNDRIKEICKEANLNRIVTRLNPTTREVERKHLYEVISSHNARKTFVGNLYKQTGDQRLVSSMSGHIPNSKAFGRYADVDPEMKRNAINKIDM